jgi:hypothetical protein
MLYCTPHIIVNNNEHLKIAEKILNVLTTEK